jgi:excisionase family DNA binding protein
MITQNMKPQNKLAVGMREAAEMMTVCCRTIQTLVATGELRSIKVGRRRLIPVTALEAFLRRDHPTDDSSREEVRQ